MQHRDHRFGQLWIVVIRKRIDEISHTPRTGARARPTLSVSPAKKIAASEAGQPPFSRDAKELFHEPPDRPVNQRRVDQYRERARQSGEMLSSRQTPIGAVPTMLSNIGCLGLEHKLRNVDMRRTLHGTHPAVDA